MISLKDFLSDRRFVDNVSETVNAIRFNDVNYDSSSHDSIVQLNSYLQANDLGTLNVNTVLGNVDMADPYNAQFAGACTVVLHKSAPIYFATANAFKKYLSENNKLPTDYKIRLCFLKDGFSSLSVSCASFSEKTVSTPGGTTTVLPIKYVKPLDNRSQALLPICVDEWIIPDHSREACVAGWRIESTKRLIAVLGSEVMIDQDKLRIEFRGDRRKVMEIDLKNESLFLTIFPIVHSACDWVYMQHKDIDSRHTLFNQQMTYLLNDGTEVYGEEVVKSFFSVAFENANSAYRYYLLDASKEVQKNLADLNKSLFDYVTKMRQSTSDLATSTWRDFAIALGLMILNFSTKQPDILRKYFNWFALGLAIYLFISFFISASSGFWYYYGAKSNLSNWKTKLYSYLSDGEFKELASDPFKNAFLNYRIVFWITAICYSILVVAILLLAFNTGSA